MCPSRDQQAKRRHSEDRLWPAFWQKGCMVLAALTEMMIPFFLAQEQELELGTELELELSVELLVQ